MMSKSCPLAVRPAAPGDEMAVAHVHVRAWQVGYRGLLSDDYLAGLNPSDRARRYTFGDVSPLKPRTFVAIESGTIVGFATVAPAVDDDEGKLGELNALYVDPDSWKKGIGATLQSAALAALYESGFRNAMLWVLAGNVRAINFYQSQGWRADGTSREAEVWGVRVEEKRFIRSLD